MMLPWSGSVAPPLLWGISTQGLTYTQQNRHARGGRYSKELCEVWGVRCEVDLLQCGWRIPERIPYRFRYPAASDDL
jgi:hypothetical protein